MAPDDDIGGGNFLSTVQQINDVAHSAMVAKIGIVCSGGICIKVVGPNRLDSVAKVRFEAKRKAACASKKID